MDSWTTLFLNIGLIIIGSALAYAICAFPRVADQLETRESSCFPSDTIPLPKLSTTFLDILQRREQNVRAKLKIAFVIICAAQLAFLAIATSFLPVSSSVLAMTFLSA